MMKPRNVPKASPSAQAPATVAEPALEKKTPLPLKFALEGHTILHGWTENRRRRRQPEPTQEPTRIPHRLGSQSRASTLCLVIGTAVCLRMHGQIDLAQPACQSSRLCCSTGKADRFFAKSGRHLRLGMLPTSTTLPLPAWHYAQRSSRDPSLMAQRFF
jgi:hypothetical protein